MWGTSAKQGISLKAGGVRQGWSGVEACVFGLPLDFWSRSKYHQWIFFLLYSFNFVREKMPAFVKGGLTMPKLFHSLQYTMTNLPAEKSIFKYWVEISPLLKIRNRSVSYLPLGIKCVYVHITYLWILVPVIRGTFI